MTGLVIQAATPIASADCRSVGAVPLLSRDQFDLLRCPFVLFFRARFGRINCKNGTRKSGALQHIQAFAAFSKHKAGDRLPSRDHNGGMPWTPESSPDANGLSIHIAHIQKFFGIPLHYDERRKIMFSVNVNVRSMKGMEYVARARPIASDCGYLVSVIIVQFCCYRDAGFVVPNRKYATLSDHQNGHLKRRLVKLCGTQSDHHAPRFRCGVLLTFREWLRVIPRLKSADYLNVWRRKYWPKNQICYAGRYKRADDHRRYSFARNSPYHAFYDGDYAHPPREH